MPSAYWLLLSTMPLTSYSILKSHWSMGTNQIFGANHKPILQDNLTFPARNRGNNQELWSVTPPFPR